ncbi:MAG TPA: anhydro-N-acetylmuramic acid kinase, partial [Rhodanobacteraceae bacterium]|nr:anhydro-N-acetylmuramic acid kinase [Rhodanobacteraceae bacterium]
RSIADALRQNAPDVRELYACGGGVHNDALMAALRAALPGATVATTVALGLDPDFVEAAGFAWLARARLEGMPGNLPSVTGARGPRVLGAIYAPFVRHCDADEGTGAQVGHRPQA